VSKRITASQVADLLRARYAPPAWAFLEQVRNATGYRKTERYADGLAMSLWPSRGLEVHGFEVKVSRSDVLKELRDPQKSSPIQRYCDRWWLVLGAAALIQPGELPATWGLMVVRGTTQLRAVTEAPQLEAAPLDRGFIASILRNFEQGYVPRRLLVESQETSEQRVAEAVVERADRDTAKKIASLERQLEYAKEGREHAEELILEFERRSGVALRTYNLGEITDAVRAVSAGSYQVIERKLEQLKRLGEGIASDAAAGLDALARADVEAAG
jgi:hypothetical protein